MTVRRRLMLAPDTQVTCTDTELIIKGPRGDAIIARSADTRAADATSTPNHCGVRELATTASQVDVARRLWARGLSSVTVSDGDRLLYRLHPRRLPPPGHRRQVGPLVLDACALVTAGPSWRGAPGVAVDRSHWWLSAPDAWADVEIIDDGILTGIRALATSDTTAAGDVGELALDLGWAGLAHPPDAAAPAWWDLPARLLHAATRRYGEDSRVGRRQTSPAGRVPTRAAGTGDPTGVPAFDEVVGRRRSTRDFDPDRTLTREQVADLLTRAMTPRPDGNRTYPGAGAASELELVLVVNRVSGLARGIHRFDAGTATLEPLDGADGAIATERLLDLARSAMSADAPPLLLCVVAHFERLMPSYDTLGYSLILKDTGVLLAHLHLTATRLGLASCVIGGGNTHVLGGALGWDPWRMASVGEIAVGLA
jgi:SagB-type dehydrogenase family enzyme